jgi:hypothetical protein
MKNQERRLKVAVSLVGMVITLVTAFAFDYWLAILEARASRTFDVTPVVWVVISSHLVLSGMSLALAWYVLCRGRPSRLIAIIFLFVGLAITLYPAMALATELLDIPFSLRWALSPDSRFVYVSAFIGVLGIASLIYSSAWGQ